MAAGVAVLGAAVSASAWDAREVTSGRAGLLSPSAMKGGVRTPDRKGEIQPGG